MWGRLGSMFPNSLEQREVLVAQWNEESNVVELSMETQVFGNLFWIRGKMSLFLWDWSAGTNRVFSWASVREGANSELGVSLQRHKRNGEAQQNITAFCLSMAVSWAQSAPCYPKIHGSAMVTLCSGLVHHSSASACSESETSAFRSNNLKQHPCWQRQPGGKLGWLCISGEVWAENPGTS